MQLVKIYLYSRDVGTYFKVGQPTPRSTLSPLNVVNSMLDAIIESWNFFEKSGVSPFLRHCIIMYYMHVLEQSGGALPPYVKSGGAEAPPPAPPRVSPPLMVLNIIKTLFELFEQVHMT